MAGWSVPEFLTGFKAQLDARSGLDALDPSPAVFTHWPTIDWSITDQIILGFTVEDDREAGAQGRNRWDELTDVECQLRIIRAGAGEAVATAARDRAKLILDEVDSQLRSELVTLADPNDNLISAQISRHRMDQFPDPGAGEPPVPVRVCVVEFTIRFQARTAQP